jgi:glycerol-3-phosphate acyltransferase PlsX
MTIIAIDAMGGDHGPPITIPAAVDVLARYPKLTLILVGDETVLQRELASYTYDSNRLSIQHATQNVEMDESPTQALRTKKDSSMRVAINLVKEGRAQACVSAGNTGALMATARFVLKTLPGIDRPAIISAFPTIVPGKCMRMLDLGANVDSHANNLVQFAVMASVLVSAVDNIAHPRICLLNIGEEDIKGNELVKQTAPLLSQLSQVSQINYTGFIEGDAIFQGEADVIVCDGFVGNVTLKTSEGVANMIGKLAKSAFMRNAWTKLIGLLAKPILKSVVNRIDPALYNGATFIGLQGTVIKSHGGASVRAFANAIKEAMIGAEKNIPDLIQHQVTALLSATTPPQSE